MASVDVTHQENLTENVSFEAVEQLVLELYGPGSPQRVRQVSESLQKLQRSSSGWQLGDALLSSKHENVRFFGALTFMVKLNSDWNTLNEEEIKQLHITIISWFIKLLRQSEAQLVIRKLCSTLVIFFLRFPATWETCIRHLVCSLAAGEVLEAGALETFASTEIALGQLSPYEKTAALWFTANLVEEADRVDANSIKNHNIHERIRTNTGDAVIMIGSSLSSLLNDNQKPPGDMMQYQEAMKCFQSWIFYSHRAFIDSVTGFDALKSLTPIAIRCLSIEEMFDSTAECLTEALTNYSAFIRESDFASLSMWFTSQAGEERYKNLGSGEYDDDSLAFGRLMLAFGDATVLEMINRPQDPATSSFMVKLHGLLCCPGYPVAEDEICAQALEYWSLFVEQAIDLLSEDDTNGKQWIPLARAHMIQVTEECWKKIHVPSNEILHSWDSNSKAGFKGFRKDVADILQQSYTFLGFEIFQKMIDLALTSIENEAWVDTEATLYCLSALSDSISGESAEDESLSQLFGSPLFARLSDTASGIPGKACHSAVLVVGGYASFFERRTEYLPSALNFLFKSIESPAQASSASKSIHALCDSCRSILTTELETFMLQYKVLAETGTADNLTKERVLGAMSSIIEAIPSDQLKLKHLEQLLDFVEQDSQKFGQAIAVKELENAKELGLGVLNCLANMGKGLQEAGDATIDLEAETVLSTFWTEGEGSQFQVRVVRIVLYIFDTFWGDGDIIEAACSVFKSGFKETKPGPFVFQPKDITSFLIRSNVNTPRIGLMLSTACSLVRSHSTQSSVKIDAEAQTLLDHILDLQQKLIEPSNDPEIAQNSIDYIIRLMPRYTNVMLNISLGPRLEQMLLFTLRCIAGTDILPKRSACSFWTSFLRLSDLPADEQSIVNRILQVMGPGFTEVLVNNFGGNASRSELDNLCEPLKKLVSRQPMSKSWLEAALMKDTFPTTRVGAPEKAAFLAKIISLRGASGTNQVVRDFWIACRGSLFAYAS